MISFTNGVTVIVGREPGFERKDIAGHGRFVRHFSYRFCPSPPPVDSLLLTKLHVPSTVFQFVASKAVTAGMKVQMELTK